MRTFHAAAVCAVVATLCARVRAAELPFDQHISAADRQFIVKQLGAEAADVDPQADLRIAKIDLNGDGRPDYVVVVDNSLYCGSAGCATSLYISKGNQYRNVIPDLLTHDIALGDGQTQGVRDLVLNGTSRWTWNGKVYGAAPAAEFKLSDELPDEPATVEAPSWQNGRLARLAPLIGTGAYATVLKDPDVAKALAALMPPADLKTVVINLSRGSVIQYIGGNIVLQGFAPHQGGEEMATVWVDLATAKVRAAVLHKGRVYVFAEDARYRDLPPLLRAWIRSPMVPEDAPPGIVWTH